MKIKMVQWGGLGNQLFRFAAGLYFAQEFGAELELLIRPDTYSKISGHPRPFQLDAFNISYPMKRQDLLDRLIQSEGRRTAVPAAIARRVRGAQLVREPALYTFNPLHGALDAARLNYLIGYWQAAEYTRTVEGVLRKELVLKTPLSGEDEQVRRRIMSSRQAVSVHVRGGDYLLNSQDTAPLSASYYRNAMEEMERKVGDPTYFVFSDDVRFAKSILPPDSDLIFVSHNDESAAPQEMVLMSACNHHIIANSTFSWWGAWLNNKPDKRVVAPRYWPKHGRGEGAKTSEHPDLYPPTWVQAPG